MSSTFKTFRKGWWVRVDGRYKRVAAGTARIAMHLVLQNMENSKQLGKSGSLRLEWLPMSTQQLDLWNAERKIEHALWETGQRPHPDAWNTEEKP